MKITAKEQDGLVDFLVQMFIPDFKHLELYQQKVLRSELATMALLAVGAVPETTLVVTDKEIFASIIEEYIATRVATELAQFGIPEDIVRNHTPHWIKEQVGQTFLVMANASIECLTASRTSLEAVLESWDEINLDEELNKILGES
jgi:hypothetical protein